MKKKITKGQPYGRVIRVIVKGDEERYYHATRGWKRRRNDGLSLTVPPPLG